MNDESMFNEPARRRLWLINKALENASLAEALALAQATEAFLAGTPASEFGSTKPPLHFVNPLDTPAESPQSKVENPPLGPVVFDSVIATRPDGGEQLDTTPLATDGFVSIVGADDVVRYLRQCDDTVVPAGDGTFLVNGRFRETLAELVKRANRMRARQRLPEFGLMPQFAPADDKPRRKDASR
jgi:hypothetical protein